MRIFSGDFVPGEIGGKAMPSIGWLGAAMVRMLVNVFWADKNIICANIIATSALFSFNAAGLPSYKSPYDVFFIIVGLAINVENLFNDFPLRVSREHHGFISSILRKRLFKSTNDCYNPNLTNAEKPANSGLSGKTKTTC